MERQARASPARAPHPRESSRTFFETLTLLGPERAQPMPERPERDVPDFKGERPQGRLLFFWGCGETAGAGQPVVLDVGKMADGVLGRSVRFAREHARAVGVGPEVERRLIAVRAWSERRLPARWSEAAKRALLAALA